MTAARATPRVAANPDLIVPGWPAPPGVHALSTTRQGGVSEGPYASLDLGFPAADGWGTRGASATTENRRRLARFLPSDPVWLDQIHGTGVARIGGGDTARMRATPPVADAAVTRERDVVLAVLAADCLPVLLAERNARAIGVAHAGWRGLARGVIENAVAAMGCDPGEIVAWFGPAIGPTAFEVGAEVRAAFVGGDPGAAACFGTHVPGKWLADLCALARRRLERAGVTDVHGGGVCTYTDAARFFSYRRDRETGRMASLLWLAGPATRTMPAR
jgi:YfiH family protein